MSVNSEPDYAKLRDVLYTAVLSDVLDSFGLKHQSMRPFVRPLSDGSTLFGPARTGRFEVRDGIAEGENPYDIEIAAIDDLNPGDVVVLACGGPTETITPWGELLTTAATARGAVGIVTDGLVRDVRAIRRTEFSVFHGGIRPLDSAGRSKMVERDTTVECAGVKVSARDLIFADDDGVIVIPSEVTAQTITKALEKIGSENLTRTELLAGRKLADIYQKYGVL